MRNVFDQYAQAENRLTHALAVALYEDPRLLRRFVAEIGGAKVQSRRALFIEEQGVPGEPSVTEEEAERRGLPGAWIHDGEGWALLIETKLTAPLAADQLRRHLATARRRGFEDVTALALTPRAERIRLPGGCHLASWRQVYRWLREHDSRGWATRVAEYLEIVEARMSGGCPVRC